MARHHLGRFDGQQAGLPKHGLRQPAAASVSRSPNKPLRCRRRGSVMARHHLGRFDGQQAGLPKAAAGCRSPCVEGKHTARDQEGARALKSDSRAFFISGGAPHPRPQKSRRGSSSGWNAKGKVGRYMTQQGNQLPAWLCRRAFKASVSACKNPQKLWTHRIPSEFNTP